MNQTISVLSAGFKSDQDYSWSNRDEGKYDAQESLRSNFKMLDDEGGPSVLVERNANSYLVLIAGLPSSRVDYLGRIIRNAVVWEELNEAQARGLSIHFLRDSKTFQSRFDRAI